MSFVTRKYAKLLLLFAYLTNIYGVLTALWWTRGGTALNKTDRNLSLHGALSGGGSGERGNNK